MIENNNHSLMTICKYCLISRYNIKFSKISPDKKEIIKAIFSVYEDKMYFKGMDWDTILLLFYKEKAFSYDNLPKNKIKKIRKKARLARFPEGN